MLAQSPPDRRRHVPSAPNTPAPLAEDLSRLDPAGWASLLPVLREVAAKLAPRFSDVMSSDDVLGELALGAYDGWLADWSERTRRGQERPLARFLENRLRDHLRQLRRKQTRRRQLITPTATGPAVETGAADQAFGLAMFSTEPPRPEESLCANELRASASGDAQGRAVIALREGGFTQREIAEVLGVSRPTIRRRLAAIAAALAALAALAMVVFWPEARVAPTVQVEPEPEHIRAPTPIQAPAQTSPREDLTPHGPVEATPAFGSVHVSSASPCTLIIDDEVHGAAPLHERVRAGEHVLEARRDGFVTYRRNIVVTEDRATRIRIDADVWQERPRGTLDSRARECTLRGDNNCVIELLEGQAQSAHEYTLLIEAYRARGQTNEASTHMESFLEQFPNHPRSRPYAEMLVRRRRARGSVRPPEEGAPHGTLVINTIPWTHVYIDGRDTEMNTPLRGLRVTPGSHWLGLRDANGVMHTLFVHVDEGETSRVIHRF